MVRSRRWRTDFTKQRPTKWQPETVKDPSGGFYAHHTDESAWSLILQLLESGHPITRMTLRQPPGKTGFVMHYRPTEEDEEIYIKLELVPGVIIGRSFHYSERNL